MSDFESYIHFTALAIEGLGIAIIALGCLYSMLRYALAKQPGQSRSYKTLRVEIGKAILLGLEVLVAADIIATVVTDPTMESVLVLGMIVLIRTFLSFALQVELEGKWPWKKISKAA